jgi:RNA polymerase sigma-70 factor (ECF subfamily)
MIIYTENEILEGCRNGNPALQKIVYEKYAPKMYSICLRYSRNREDARDLMHDGFIKVFSNFKSYRHESTLDAWITRVIINNILNQLRKKNIELSHQKEYQLELRNEQEYVEDDNYLEKFTANDIKSAILMLPPGQRTVLNLYVFEDYSHKEIAKQTGISEGTSKSQLARARITLKQLLMKNKTHSDELHR